MATQYDPIPKRVDFLTTEQTPRNIADVLRGIENALTRPDVASYILRCPTTGYTLSSVTVWGVTKSLYAITLYADSSSNPLSDFHSGMKEDYPLNISGSQSDFSKLYAHEIGEGEVTFYFTSAPSSAFNVLIREAV